MPRRRSREGPAFREKGDPEQNAGPRDNREPFLIKAGKHWECKRFLRKPRRFCHAKPSVLSSPRSFHYLRIIVRRRRRDFLSSFAGSAIRPFAPFRFHRHFYSLLIHRELHNIIRPAPPSGSRRSMEMLLLDVPHLRRSFPRRPIFHRRLASAAKGPDFGSRKSSRMMKSHLRAVSAFTICCSKCTARASLVHYARLHFPARSPSPFTPGRPQNGLPEEQALRGRI